MVAKVIDGKRMALILMRKEAIVAICHAKTCDRAQFALLTDILVVAAGKPNLIAPQMLKTGAVVIEGVRQKASCITLAPGGVGRMTATMPTCNTVQSAEFFFERKQRMGAGKSAAGSVDAGLVHRYQSPVEESNSRLPMY